MKERGARALISIWILAAISILVWFSRPSHPALASRNFAPPSAQPTSPETRAAGVGPGWGAGLLQTIDNALQETVSQESAKDATCWTTVRMMDAHFAGTPISDEVAALKIEACKTLVCQLWRRASRHAAPRELLGQDDIDPAMPTGMLTLVAQLQHAPGVLSDGTVEAVMRRDYQRITENKRYLISVAQEALVGTGLFSGRDVDILPLTAGAADRLAAFATVATTAFLESCGRIAQANGHAEVLGDDMKRAFAEALTRFAPDADSPSPAASRPSASMSAMLELTRTVIANKITALRAWNAAIWKDHPGDPTDHQRELLNRFCKAKFDQQGFAELTHKLELCADYISWGVTPFQHNTFAAAINRHHSDILDGEVFARARKPYIELDWGMNVINDLFPRTIAANGDVTVRLVGSPGDRSHSRPSAEFRLLDYELDAVRDTVIHWSVMQHAWSRMEARPADPFVLEILADRLSELAIFMIRATDDAAQRSGRSVIDATVCDYALDDFQFAVPTRPEATWGKAQLASKPEVLARIPKVPFLDGSAAPGFPSRSLAARPTPASLTASESMSLVDYMGAGVAVGDFDGDGLPDLFLPGEGGNRLLRNLGGHRFKDVSEELGITDTRLDDVHQALFVDYDNDGRLDLFIVHSASPSRLFHQLANGHFEDVSGTCGIVTGPAAHDAVWFDYDNDGLLDCFVGHYGATRPRLDGRNGSGGRLFHNLGNGHFADVTAASGTGTTGWTLACAAFDYDHDGWPDLFVANDYGRSELFRNNGDGTFSERGRAAGIDDRGSSMNASVIDLDGEGWMGLYITQIDMFSKSIGFVFPQDKSVLNINERILRSTFSIAGNKLFRNQGDGTFASVDPQVFEPGDRGWAWSANFFDYDNSGTDDCYMTNGWLDGTPAARQRHQFFIGGHGRFFLWDGGGDQGYASNARGCVAADLGGHGRIDLVVNDFGERPRLLLNQSTDRNHWLKVKLRGVRCNRYGIGAEVAVLREDGTRQWRAVTCGSNYLSQEDTTLHFGLGPAVDAAGIEVRWPGNRLQRVPGPIKADTTVEVLEMD